MVDIFTTIIVMGRFKSHSNIQKFNGDLNTGLDMNKSDGLTPIVVFIDYKMNLN